MTLGPVYDQNGRVSGWSEADRLYSDEGEVIGWLRGGAVYSLNGDHVGWHERGQFRDSSGCVVGWTRDALGGPAKPGRIDVLHRPALGRTPSRPTCARRMARGVSLPSWSSRTWETYLG